MTKGDQRKNLIKFRGETHSQRDWAGRVDLIETTLSRRLRSGWSIERALTTPASSHKLTVDQVREIRRLYAEGESTQQAIADRFGCTQANVCLIVRGKNWKRFA